MPFLLDIQCTILYLESKYYEKETVPVPAVNTL